MKNSKKGQITIEQVIKVIKNERLCVLRNIAGCDRDCKNCDLVLPDSEIIDAYNYCLEILNEKLKGKKNGK